MTKERVGRALPYNCPDCEAGIGKLCLSVRGKPMAYYVHLSREPKDPMERLYSRNELKQWLMLNADILLSADE